MSPSHLTLEQLDPELAAKARTHLAALPANQRRLLGMIGVWTIGGSLAAMLSSGLLTMLEPGSVLGVGAGVAIMGLALTAGAARTKAFTKQLEGELAAADLRAVAEKADLSRAEREYLLAAAALVNAASLLGPTMLADLVRQLNHLVRSDRQLEAQHRQVVPALGSASPAEMEAERDDLLRRREKAPDAGTREALERSLALCNGRLESAAAIAPVIASVEAQRDVVYQTLASVQSALLRMTAAPSAPVQAGVQEILTSAAQVTADTCAVEEAVQEVVALRT
jgi:hypothetical protein